MSLGFAEKDGCGGGDATLSKCIIISVTSSILYNASLLSWPDIECAGGRDLYLDY